MFYECSFQLPCILIKFGTKSSAKKKKKVTEIFRSCMIDAVAALKTTHDPSEKEQPVDKVPHMVKTRGGKEELIQHKQAWQDKEVLQQPAECAINWPWIITILCPSWDGLIAGCERQGTACHHYWTQLSSQLFSHYSIIFSSKVAPLCLCCSSICITGGRLKSLAAQKMHFILNTEWRLLSKTLSSRTVVYMHQAVFIILKA